MTQIPTDKPTEAMIEAGKILPHSMSSETALEYEKRALTALARHFLSAPQEPVADDDALIELCARLRMKAKEVVLEETNSWSLAKAANEAADAIERLQAKAPERGEPQ